MLGRIKEAAISLGRSGNQLGLCLTNTERESNHEEQARSVDRCLAEFVGLLCVAFGLEGIDIGKRVIVMKESVRELRKEAGWRRVLKGDVMVWTFDFLQPTCCCLFPEFVRGSDKDMDGGHGRY